MLEASKRQLTEAIRSSEPALIERFASLPHAVRLPVPKQLDAVYVPGLPGAGSGDHPILLVAHTDTVFDRPGRVVWHGHIGHSAHPDIGLGADDRAGCAALWALRNTGASLLIVPAEERGCIGSRYVAEHYADLLKHHCFAVQFDRRGSSDLVFYDGEPDELLNILEPAYGGYAEADGSYSDVAVLCPALGIAGVNISIGFDDEHTPDETIDAAAWTRTVDNARNLIAAGDYPPIPYVPDHTLYDPDDYGFGDWSEGLDDFDEPLADVAWCDDCALAWDADDIDPTAPDPKCPVCGGPLLVAWEAAV
ncbi:MAG: M28 family peptidase [Planctomycetota bacterium]